MILFNFLKTIKLKILKLLTLAMFSLLALQHSAAQSESLEYVVFSIEGIVEELSLGQILKEGHQFEIPKNTTVNLISKSGSVITLEGPTKATVTNDKDNKNGEHALTSISNLLFDDKKFVQVVGGTRSTFDETNLGKYLVGQNQDQTWRPVLSSEEHYCLTTKQPVLHREEALQDLSIQFSDQKTSEWKSGNYSLDLAPFIDDLDTTSQIELAIDGKKIKVFVSADTHSSTSNQVAWLANQGCKKQALMLLRSNIIGN